MAKLCSGLLFCLFGFTVVTGQLSWGVCDKVKKVEIRFRNYYTFYLGLNDTSGELVKKNSFYELLQNTVPKCCSNVTLEFIYLNSTDVKDIEFESVSNFHQNDVKPGVFTFYFPEFAEHKAKIVYDFEVPFVKLRRSPGQAVVMLTPPSRKQIGLKKIFVESYPLFLFMLTLSWTVGILGWMLDHWKNGKEFPSPFILGMFEGFWWSVVTMTTVGYGDKSPKSAPARILAVIWVMISAVLLSLFTAHTTEILNSNDGNDYSSTVGKKIGALQSKHFHEFQLNLDAELINFYDYPSMDKALRSGEIDRVIFPHHRDLKVFLSMDGSAAEQYKIAKTFDSPFQIGMVLSRSQSAITDLDNTFLNCLRTTTSQFQKMESFSANISKKPFTYVSSTDGPALNQESLIQFTYFLLMVTGGLTALGVLWDISKYCYTRNATREGPVEMKEIGHTNADVRPKNDISFYEH